MLTHSIAGLKIGLEYQYPRLIHQAAAYVIEPSDTDFDVVLPEGLVEKTHEDNTHLSIDECEYIQTGFIFYRKLLDFDGMLLHASAVIKDGYAYLFSAPSGTGKSTHTALWCKVFEDAQILNDDKPAIRIIEGKVYVFGTPWSGKSDLNLNLRVPLGGICFLERSKDNFIEKIQPSQAIHLLLNQTVRPRMVKNMDRMLTLLDHIIQNTTIYRMGCNMEDEAAVMAYETMRVC